MLDTMTPAGDRIVRSARLLDAGENLLDRCVADRMDRELVAERVIMRQVSVHLRVGETENAAIVRITDEIRRAHRGGEAAGAAVAEDLHGTVAQVSDLAAEPKAGSMRFIADAVGIP